MDEQEAKYKRRLNKLDDEALDQWIIERHANVGKALSTALQNAKEAGDGLIIKKKRVGHGGYTRWVEENFDGCVETARGYARIAKNWHHVNRRNGVDDALEAIRLLNKYVKKKKPE